MNSDCWCNWRVDTGGWAHGSDVADDLGNFTTVGLGCDVWAGDGAGSVDSGGVSTEGIGS